VTRDRVTCPADSQEAGERQVETREIWELHGGGDSSRGLLGCNAV